MNTMRNQKVTVLSLAKDLQEVSRLLEKHQSDPDITVAEFENPQINLPKLYRKKTHLQNQLTNRLRRKKNKAILTDLNDPETLADLICTLEGTNTAKPDNTVPTNPKRANSSQAGKTVRRSRKSTACVART